jgi:hypothetical protein
MHVLLALCMVELCHVASPGLPPYPLRPPLPPQQADLALNIIFTAEMLLRVLALGGPFVYLSQPWNVFDSIMVSGRGGFRPYTARAAMRAAASTLELAAAQQ